MLDKRAPLYIDYSLSHNGVWPIKPSCGNALQASGKSTTKLMPSLRKVSSENNARLASATFGRSTRNGIRVRIPSVWDTSSSVRKHTIIRTLKRGKKYPNTLPNTRPLNILKSNAFRLFHVGEMICILRTPPSLIFNPMW